MATMMITMTMTAKIKMMMMIIIMMMTTLIMMTMIMAMIMKHGQKMIIINTMVQMLQSHGLLDGIQVQILIGSLQLVQG